MVSGTDETNLSMHLVTVRARRAPRTAGTRGMTTGKAPSPWGGEGGRARAPDASRTAAEGERLPDLLAGERVWEAAWDAWANARAAAEERGSGR
jgi:hypothetical protein